VYESFKAKYLIEKENWEKKYGQNELAEKPKKENQLNKNYKLYDALYGPCKLKLQLNSWLLSGIRVSVVAVSVS